jgi:hypothetical protein
MRALDYAAGLLVMARKDFDALRGMVGNPLFADEIFGFHAQQAIEKMLKAWLAARGIAFPLTHDLSRLFELLEENGADVSLFWPLVQYTVFAVQARYEACLMEAEAPIDRVAAIAEVRKLRDSVAVATGISAIGSVNEGNESHA